MSRQAKTLEQALAILLQRGPDDLAFGRALRVARHAVFIQHRLDKERIAEGPRAS